MRPTHAVRGGFSLIEAVIVVTVLVLLTGVVVPIVSHHVGEVRSTQAEGDMKRVADAFTRYLSQTGSWPSNGAPADVDSVEELTGFSCLFQNTAGAKGWNGPYLAQGVRTGAAWSVAVPANHDLPASGLVDPWSRLYKLYVFTRRGAMGAAGGLVLLSAGENGIVDSTTEQVAQGQASGDDVLHVISRKL